MPLLTKTKSSDPIISCQYLSPKPSRRIAKLIVKTGTRLWMSLERLKDNIMAAVHLTQSEVLIQRAWLVHWGLFVYFNHPQGRDKLIDDFLHQKTYLNAIQTMCPHILRYITTAVVISKRRRDGVKELIKVLQQIA
eukprot:sb/3474672/